MTTTQSPESARFTTMHQRVMRNTSGTAEDCKVALNRMTVHGVIEAASNAERMTAAPEDQGVKVLPVDDVTFQAYAYLSASGNLQIWMEAIHKKPQVAILATARLSWDFVNQSPEQAETHQAYANRIRELRKRP